jgi:RimJ/RimL family protein N-acetyltransferase
MIILRTNRLDIVASTPDHLNAELESTSKLGALLGATVPPDWSPGEYDREAIEFFKARLEENPDAVGWYSWYAILRPSENNAATLVGAGGYFGPPKSDGTLEVGYSVVSSFRGKGLARELLDALVANAFADTRVTQIIAHTTPMNVASWRVLERCGFLMVGPGPGQGTIKYVLTRHST